MSRIDQVPQNIRNEIENILDRLNSDRIRTVMEVTNWKWVHVIDESGIPEVWEIRSMARDLLAGAYLGAVGNGTGFCASGGFEVTCDLQPSPYIHTSDPIVSFKLVFALESLETW